VGGETIAEGGRRETTGEVRVVHWPGVWLIESKLAFAMGAGGEVETSVEVTPLADDADHTTWTAFSSVLGKHRGHFVVFDETILSSFESSEPERRGTDVLRRIDENTYESVGALFEGARRVASWALQMTRRR
jgi:hypothetical protein